MCTENTSANETKKMAGMRLRTKVILTVFAVLTIVGIIEGALWEFCPIEDPNLHKFQYHRFLPNWNIAPKTPPYEYKWYGGPLHGVEQTGHEVRVNQYGYLYPQEKGKRENISEIRIAAIGGSTVECVALGPKKRWPAVLERLISEKYPDRKVTVLNLGISGLSTRAHLATVTQHMLDLDVDCAVFMLGANDLYRSGDYRPMLHPSCFKKIKKITWGGLLINRFQLGRRYFYFRRDRRMRRKGQPYFYKQKSKLAKCSDLPFELDIGEKALAGYERNIISLAAVCLAHDMKVLFTTQPMLWKDKLSKEEQEVSWLRLRGHKGRAYRLKSKNAAALLGKLNRRLLQTCHSKNYPALELASLIPRSLDYFYDDVHFNDRGAALIAQHIGKAILAHKLIPK